MVSIIVPVFNGENYIDDCLQSILHQTYRDWELILIDNASTDGSLKRCKEYARKYDRIQVLQQHHNMGVSVARNLGVEKATGEFVTFVDVDDWVTNDYLAHLVAVQKEKNARMVVGEYRKAYTKDREVLQNNRKKEDGRVWNETEEGQKAEEKRKHLDVREYLVKDYIEQYFLEGNTHCWGVLYDRELLADLQFPKGMTIGEDMLFLLEAAQKVSSVVVASYPGYYYYINESGAMKKKFTPDYMDQIYCWERALQIIEKGYPKLSVKVESILVVSVLLVVGKLSELSTEERLQYETEEKECYETFLKYGRKKEIRKYLPAGYPFKVWLYGFFPKLYIKLYGRLKAK